MATLPKPQVIEAICRTLSDSGPGQAAAVARRDYPFTPSVRISRRYGESRALRLFLRDGFVDRYSGDQLIFPGVFRILSCILPEEFPFHRNWKMSETHSAYWELFPTIDHLVPIARGGSDSDENWVTTSMLHNTAKANWTIEELGWRLYPAGDLENWDGMARWFLDFTGGHPEMLADAYVRRWYNAACLPLKPCR